MSTSLSDRFCNTFHIGKVKRKPMRQEVTALRAQALKLPKSDKAKEMIGRLDTARDTIYAKVRTNQKRQESVDAARDICNEVRPKIKELEQQQRQLEPVTFKTKTATKEDQARAKLLLNTLDEVVKTIVTTFTATTGKPQVLMPEAMSRFALNGQAERIRLQVNSSIVTEARKTEIDGEIEGLRTAITEAADYITEQRNAVADYTYVLDRGNKVLEEVEDYMGEEVARTPLALKLAQLKAAMYPEGGLLNPPGIERLADAALQEIDAAKYAEDYAEKAGEAITQGDDCKAAMKLFDDQVNGPLETFRQLAEPMGDSRYQAFAIEAGRTHAMLSKPQDPAQDADALAKDLVRRIAAAGNDVANTAKTLRGDVDELRRQLDDAIRAVRDTRDMAVFKADWKQIDAAMESIARMMPPGQLTKDSPGLTGETLANLAAAWPLTRTVLTLAQGIATDRGAIGDFDARLASLKQAIKDADGKGKPFPTYFPKEWKTVGDDLAKLEKGLPTTKAKAASTALDKIKTSFEAKLQEATALGDYIENDVKPVQREKFDIYLGVMLGGYEPPMPNAPQVALNALADELDKTPPTRATVEKLLGELQTAFKDIKNGRDLLVVAEDTHQQKKQEEKDRKQRDKDTRKPLEERLYSLKMQLEEATAAVKVADGDTNAIDQLQRMREQAEAEIEALDVAKATKTMDRMQQRIDLVLAHPEGEARRRSKELPDLYNEWRAARSEAAANLVELKKTIDEYDPGDEQVAKSVRRLGRRVDAYRTTFAKGRSLLRPYLGALSDATRPEQERRQAREDALAGISDLQRGLQAHPLTELLATSPIPAARAVPRRLYGGLDRLRYTILTCVE